MILEATQKEQPAGILIDTGTNKRIPFARKANFDTGEYEAFAVAPDGESILADEQWKPVIIKGRAVGKLQLVPFNDAAQFGWKPPQLKQSPIQTLPADLKLDGLERYKKAYFEVWNGHRQEAKKCVADRWDNKLDTLKGLEFLDTFVLKRRTLGVS